MSDFAPIELIILSVHVPLFAQLRNAVTVDYEEKPTNWLTFAINTGCIIKTQTLEKVYHGGLTEHVCVVSHSSASA